MTHEFLGPALLLLVPNVKLMTIISIGSVLCLGIGIAKVQVRRIAYDRKIASGLAHAIRDHVL